jgi:hypothetical protein
MLGLAIINAMMLSIDNAVSKYIDFFIPGFDFVLD